jgi:hypothetical protein
MAFESLSDKLNNVFKKLRGKGRLSEQDVKEAMREVRLALLEADVSYKVVKDFEGVKYANWRFKVPGTRVLFYGALQDGFHSDNRLHRVD